MLPECVAHLGVLAQLVSPSFFGQLGVGRYSPYRSAHFGFKAPPPKATCRLPPVRGLGVAVGGVGTQSEGYGVNIVLIIAVPATPKLSNCVR